MTDTSTLALHFDKASYVEGDPIVVSSSGTVTRTTVTTEVVGFTGTTTTGETITTDAATLTHTATQDMAPRMTTIGGAWTVATDGATATSTAALGMAGGVLHVPFILSDGSSAIASAPYPTVTAKPVPVPTLRFPGDVTAGFLRWGCAYDTNSDPHVRHEVPAGVPVGVRRTYFDLSASSITSTISTVTADAAAGRVSWISHKLKNTSYTWASVAAGAADPAISGMLAKLKAIPGAVIWWALHHEPDEEFGGTAGSLADWKGMQSKGRALITASGAKNIAFCPVFMPYSFGTSVTGNHKASDAWFVPGVWDFVGLDPYWNPPSWDFTHDIGGAGAFPAACAWAKSHGLPVAIGEVGYRDIGTAQQAAFLQAFYDYAIKQAFVGVAYFDVATSLDPLGGPSLTKFHDLMKLSTSLPAGRSGG